MGPILRAVARAADIQGRDGATRVLALVARDGLVGRPERIRADGGYRGKLVHWVAERYGRGLDLVRRPDGEPGAAVLPRRWIAARTFGSPHRDRRRSTDHEFYAGVAEASIHAASIQPMLRRLTTSATISNALSEVQRCHWNHTTLEASCRTLPPQCDCRR
jgi:putative transposase